MKKILLYVTFILILMLSLTACGKEDKKTGEKQELFPDREKISTKLLDVYHKEDWKCDTENLSNEDGYVNVEMFMGDDIENAQVTVKIVAEQEEAFDFRKDLLYNNITLESYADGSALTATVGNTKYTSSESDYGKTYLYRHSESGISYKVSVEGDTLVVRVGEVY